ncbi:hypothetical protein L226DRAFT_342176 [Lentinus tigrinus ALCF2SS1-7]|uniref:uncharacterized protein n=1 Tax=Lentinus tigrinus ALCF2SS1-7 TaxID=1328758 RepID=UPI001165E3F4|nr:hypothetical protein L226DRAFT_342176 [Lentinus tigrinus ALCF2SS1-7]
MSRRPAGCRAAGRDSRPRHPCHPRRPRHPCRPCHPRRPRHPRRPPVLPIPISIFAVLAISSVLSQAVRQGHVQWHRPSPRHSRLRHSVTVSFMPDCRCATTYVMRTRQGKPLEPWLLEIAFILCDHTRRLLGTHTTPGGLT